MDETRIDSLENHLATKQKNFKVDTQSALNSRGLGLLATGMEMTLDSFESLDKKISELKDTVEKIQATQNKLSTYFGTFSSLMWALGIISAFIITMHGLGVFKIIWFPK